MKTLPSSTKSALKKILTLKLNSSDKRTHNFALDALYFLSVGPTPLDNLDFHISNLKRVMDAVNDSDPTWTQAADKMVSKLQKLRQDFV